MNDAQAIISRLDLQPHPEGGWFRETWRGAPLGGTGGRGPGTAILYLLAAGERSHWHRIDATELWLFQAGAPLLLQTAGGTSGEAGRAPVRLGPDVASGDRLQHAVEPWEWQAAESAGPWSLVACIVVPAFEFSGFELAGPGWAPA